MQLQNDSGDDAGSMVGWVWMGTIGKTPWEEVRCYGDTSDDLLNFLGIWILELSPTTVQRKPQLQFNLSGLRSDSSLETVNASSMSRTNWKLVPPKTSSI